MQSIEPENIQPRVYAKEFPKYNFNSQLDNRPDFPKVPLKNMLNEFMKKKRSVYSLKDQFAQTFRGGAETKGSDRLSTILRAKSA
jgi:hypothetical protein